MESRHNVTGAGWEMKPSPREKRSYFFETFDLLLAQGEKPEEALLETARSYAYVFYTEDGRSPLARSAEVVLKRLQEEQ